MKIDIWSPLPPVPSGIAHYTKQVFSTGFDDFDIQFVDRAEAPVRSDAVPIYQLGNNPYHEFIYLAALDRPGIVEIHDFSEHHLVTEMTLAKGDKTAYEYVLGEAAGERGISLAQKRGQKKSEYHPQLQFEMPLLEPFIRDAYHVIVHSRWARQRTKMVRRDAPVSMIPHFCQTPEESGRAGVSLVETSGERRIASLSLKTRYPAAPKFIGCLRLAVRKSSRSKREGPGAGNIGWLTVRFADADCTVTGKPRLSSATMSFVSVSPQPAIQLRKGSAIWRV